MRKGAIWACALLWALTVPFAPARAQEPAQNADQEEAIIITGKQPGPKMWVVTDADSEVWILGITNYLPKTVRWDSARVASVLDRANLVVTQTEVKIGAFTAIDAVLTDRDVFFLPKKQRLAQVLEPRLYARFLAARVKYGLDANPVERLRPAFAGFMLIGGAVKQAGLDAGKNPEDQVKKLARRRGVKIRPLQFIKGKKALNAAGEISDAAQLACLDASLVVAERANTLIRNFSVAWAKGDIATLRANPPPPELRVCEALLRDSVDLLDNARTAGKAAYLREVADGLAQPGTRLLLINMQDALDDDGLIASLRTKGYAVEGP